MNKYLDKNYYEPLECESCHKDLLETGLGIFIWVPNSDKAATPQFVHAYWACKGQCDTDKKAEFGVEKSVTPWTDISDLTNPLEYERWDRATSRLIDQDEVSVAVVAKVEELKRVVAQVAMRPPTEQDIARFWEIRMMDGL